MKKDTKQHIIYAGVLLVVALTGFYYFSSTIDVLRADFSVQLSQLSQQIQKTQADLGSSVEQLTHTDTLLDQSLINLSSKLQEKETQIKSLSGELEQVKVKSAQEVSDLQSKIANLKVQYEDFSDVIEATLPGVVSIQTDTGQGSGFLVRKDGYIITNYHVIQGARAGAAVTTDGKNHAVRIVGFNANADIAVLKMNGTFTRLRFGDSGSVKVGQKAIAVGNPGGLDFTVTQGIVSAVNRGDSKGNKFIQIDVPINPGNSGGPLVDASGEVIGVNSIKISGFEGLGFAIASDEVKPIADDLIAKDGQ